MALPPPATPPSDSAAGAIDPRSEAIAASPEFKELVRAKLRFIVPGTIFFVCYYLLLLLLNGFAPAFMKREVLGHVNVAYLFGISQFFMAWILAGLYVRTAGGWDRRAERILRGHGHS